MNFVPCFGEGAFHGIQCIHFHLGYIMHYKNMFSVFCLLVLIHALAQIFFPYTGTKAHAQEKIRVVDDTGYELVLDKPATRVVGLYGALSELMLALGLGHTLVGRTAVDADVQGLEHLPAVGTHMRPNPELIVSLQPDVVLQVLGSKHTTALGLGMRKLGVPVLLFRLESFEDIHSVLLRLGIMAGVQSKAESLVASYVSRIGYLRTILMDEKRVSLCYELRSPHLLMAGGKSIITDILTAAGGRNVVSSPEQDVHMSLSSLILQNPEAYIIQQGPMNPDPDPLTQRPSYEKIQAVRNNRILTVRDIDFSRPGPRAIDAAEMLAKWLHPTVDFTMAVPQVDANARR